MDLPSPRDISLIWTTERVAFDDAQHWVTTKARPTNGEYAAKYTGLK